MKAFAFYLMFVLLTARAWAQVHAFDPPWNTPPANTLNFTVLGVDNVPDIFGDITDPQLVVFMGGNQFMVLDDLIAAFKTRYPQYKRILVETLPPGLLLQQIKSGSLQIGNMRISLVPDIYTGGKNVIAGNAALFSRTQEYSGTKLALMVQKGNPKNIATLQDLGRSDIRVSMPNKRFEGIGKNVEDAFLQVGGQGLVDRIMQQKVQDSTTFLTQIHHRQSPMRLLYDQSDAAPVWETEILYQQSLGHAVDQVALNGSFNTIAVSAAGMLQQAPHKEAAADFLDFLMTPEAQSVFKKFGFLPVAGRPGNR